MDWRCPQCRQPISTEAAAGSGMDCPHCRSQVTVPAAESGRSGLKLKHAPERTEAPMPPMVTAPRPEVAVQRPAHNFVPLLIKLIVLAVLITAGVASYQYYSLKPKRVTKANYDRLHAGMSIEELRNLFGRPAMKTYDARQSTIFDQLLVMIEGMPDKNTFRPLLTEVESACIQIRIPRDKAIGSGDETIADGPEARAPDGTTTRSKVSAIHYEFGHNPLRFQGAIQFIGHETPLNTVSNQFVVVSNGSLRFDMTNQQDPIIPGTMMRWNAEDGRVIYVNFTPRLSFWAYQGLSAEAGR